MIAARGGETSQGRLPASAALYRARALPWWWAGLGCGILGLSFVFANLPWLGVGLVLAGILAVVLTLRPLAVVTAALFIGPLDLSFLTGGQKGLFESLGGLDMNGLRLIAVVGGLGVLMVSHAELRAVALGKYGRWYALFLLFAAGTLAYSASPLDGVRFFLKLAYPFLMFIAILGLVRTRAQLDRLGDWTLAGAFVMTVVLNPLFTLAGGFIYDDVLGSFRVSGVGLHPAPWSFYLLLMLAASVTRFATRREFRYLGLAAVCAFWITLALARTAMLAGAVALGVMMVHSALVQRNYRMLLVGLLAGGILGSILWPTFAGKTFGQGSAPGFFEFLLLLRDPFAVIPMLNLSGRELVWPVVFLFFLSSPLIGIGLGGTTPLMQTQFNADAGGVVHNEFLRIATETGVIGFALFAIALLAWWRGVLAAAVTRSGDTAEWTMPALAALVVWAITGFSDNAIDYYTSVSQFVALFAAGAILMREKFSSDTDGRPGAPDQTAAATKVRA